MTISALVVVYAVDRADAVRSHLKSDPRITIGDEPEFAADDPRFSRLPVVLECGDGEESETLVRDLQQVDGILQVEIVLVDFAQQANDTSSGAPAEDQHA